MNRLVVVTCLALGAALAKPPPERADGPGLPWTFQNGLEDPQPIPFDSRAVYTLADGRYYFTSPNYPNNYGNDQDTSLTVRGDQGQNIALTCSPFRLESHSTCGYDFLSINDLKYCGTNGPPSMTVTELRMRFKSDYSVTASGYRCDLTIGGTATTAAPPSGDCQCGLRQTRVVGGEDADAGEFPWQAGLVSPGGTRTFCGGSVISKRYVLTAAHCTASSSPGSLQVLLGDRLIGTADAGEQRFSVVQIINHPSYTSATGSGMDFSLLKVDRDITFSSTIRPVCLAEAGQTYAGVTALASGYGRVGATLPQATTLKHVQLPVWAQATCAQRWGLLKDNMICAGGLTEGGKSVCMGDSGGPLVTEVSGRFRLIGVVSFGQPCAVANTPDVFARVTSALSWIASSTTDAPTCNP